MWMKEQSVMYFFSTRFGKQQAIVSIPELVWLECTKIHSKLDKYERVR